MIDIAGKEQFRLVVIEQTPDFNGIEFGVFCHLNDLD